MTDAEWLPADWHHPLREQLTDDVHLRPIRAEDACLVLALGVAGSLGQYLITEAFRLGEASLLAPLEYTALVWGVLWDATLWGVLPDGATWVGAAIIVASGLYLVRREGARAVAAPPP